MKKLLSFFLVLTLCIGLLPTVVFATPAAEFTVDFSTVDKSTLDGEYVLKGETAKGTNWSVNTDKTVSTLFTTTSKPIRIYAEKFDNTRAQIGFNDTLIGNNENILIMNFDVPSTGWYDVDAFVYKSIYSGAGEIYIDGIKECVHDFFSAAGEGKDATDTYGRKNETIDITEAPVFLTEGTHEIKIVGQKTARTEKANIYQYVDICYFKFTPSSDVKEVSFVLDSAIMNKAYTALTDEQKPTIASNGWVLKKADSNSLLDRTIMRPYGLQIQSSTADGYTYLTLEFDVASPGNYDLALTYLKYYLGGYGDVYVDDKCVGEVNYYSPKDETTYGNYEELRPLNLSEGTHTLTFAINRTHETGGYVNMYPSSLMLIKKDTLSALSSAELTISDNELTANETVTPGYMLTYTNGAVTEVKTYSGAADNTVAISLTSSNPSVVKVVNNTLVATGGGEAEIYADITVNGISVKTNTVTVTVAEPERNTVSFAQTTNVEGHNSISVQSVERGTSVSLTAHKENIDGYKFVGWRRGADEENMDTWVKIGGDTYDVWTNTYLTAIYEPITDDAEKVVEFWNQNGTYIGSMDEETYNAQEALFTPTLTGFETFLGWFTDGGVEFKAGQNLSDGVTNAVAQYTAYPVSGVTRGGAPIADADVYNKAVELTKNNASSTCWKRDGNIVSYDDTYTYHVWGATNITEGTEEVVDKTPVGILEYSETYGAYMLEYDQGAYEIVEAGIIFGDGSQTIDSCDKKYTSQRKVSHNQFTAPEQSGKDAIGYIIWKDNAGGYNVKYIAE